MSDLTDPIGTGSSPAAPAGPEPDARPEPRPTRVTPAVGALLVVVAVTSLVDDAGLVSVRWWVPFAAAAILGALAVVALTVRRLLAPGITLASAGSRPHPRSTPERP